jgi:hypothetical protein
LELPAHSVSLQLITPIQVSFCLFQSTFAISRVRSVTEKIIISSSHPLQLEITTRKKNRNRSASYALTRTQQDCQIDPRLFRYAASVAKGTDELGGGPWPRSLPEERRARLAQSVRPAPRLTQRGPPLGATNRSASRPRTDDELLGLAVGQLHRAAPFVAASFSSISDPLARGMRWTGRDEAGRLCRASPVRALALPGGAPAAGGADGASGKPGAYIRIAITNRDPI